MLKKMFITIAALSVLFSCTDKIDGNDPVDNQERYPLTAFAVQVGSSWYHADIDQNAHRAVIGAIENTDLITDVQYTLYDDESTISPDPKELLGKWETEQQLTVDVGGKQTLYTLVFSAFAQQDKSTIFFDDFDVDGRPDTDKWVLCPKGASDWNNQMSESYDQAYVSDGNLVLVAEKVGNEYRAGGIKTEGKFGFTYGMVECRARITKYPDGAFPAIWMMPQKFLYSGWPACGEIDIMEHIKQEKNVWQTLHTHYANTLGYISPAKTTSPSCNIEEYNVYGCEWTSEYIKFYLNGEETLTYPNLHLENESEMKQWPFGDGSEFYLILNMGLGDPGTWAGAIDDTNLPAVMEVDWIRVKKLEEE